MKLSRDDLLNGLHQRNFIFRSRLFFDDRPISKELGVVAKISSLQDLQIIGDRVMFYVKVQGKPDLETKNISDAIAYYNQ